MRFFGRKNNDQNPPDDNAGDSSEFQPQPEKARKWFDHGRTMAASSNHEYALTCFASGIKLDPGVMSAHEAMWESAVQYFNQGGKPASGKEIKQIDGPGPVDKFAAVEFAWMKDLNNLSLAIKTLNAAAKAGQFEFGQWIAPKIKNMVFKQKKPSKSAFVAAKDAFGEIGAWAEAFACGEAAVRLDPTDTNLLNELKQLTAQRAISEGGYAQANAQEGGFRSFVKDADKQRELEQREAISGAGSSAQANLDRAKAEYEENPLSPEAVNRYAQLLKRSGTEESEELAWSILMKAFQEIGEFRFRMAAGDIRIAQAKRSYRQAREAADAKPDDAALKAAAEERRKALQALETQEYTERSEKYPTDRGMKLELGRLLFEQEKFDDAMPYFQAAKEEGRLRATAAHMLGKCFAAEGWHQEAIGEFREALEEVADVDKERELDIRYDLMESVFDLAKKEQSVQLAKEAVEICSGIIRKDITFRDIRQRRKDVEALLRELGG
ncbi:MAG: hypothetical protein KDA22_03475 [Phycisphaerales bacterium]|nr:hypothetical protein [Phycisphaerales bacterium]